MAEKRLAQIQAELPLQARLAKRIIQRLIELEWDVGEFCDFALLDEALFRRIINGEIVRLTGAAPPIILFKIARHLDIPARELMELAGVSVETGDNAQEKAVHGAAT